MTMPSNGAVPSQPSTFLARGARLLLLIFLAPLGACGADSPAEERVATATGAVTTTPSERRDTRRLEALNEDVTYVTGQTAEGVHYKYVQRADGRFQRPGTAEAEAEAAWRAAHGVTTRRLVRKLETMAPSDAMDIAVFFDASEIFQPLRDDLRSWDLPRKRAAIAQVRTALAEAAAVQRERLEEMGSLYNGAGELMPVLFVTATAEQVRQAARLPGLLVIDDEEGGEGRALGGATGVQNSSAELEIDTQFNQAGFYGTSASVGSGSFPPVACGSLTAPSRRPG